jgi:hypothetical protein
MRRDAPKHKTSLFIGWGEGSNSTYRRLVFVQHLIVLGHGDTENDRRYIFEAVDPLLSFRPLTSHVKQSVKQLQTITSEPRNHAGDWQFRPS